LNAVDAGTPDPDLTGNLGSLHALAIHRRHLIDCGPYREPVTFTYYPTAALNDDLPCQLRSAVSKRLK
jgi:hypothetical protein